MTKSTEWDAEEVLAYVHNTRSWRDLSESERDAWCARAQHVIENVTTDGERWTIERLSDRFGLTKTAMTHRLRRQRPDVKAQPSRAARHNLSHGVRHADAESKREAFKQLAADRDVGGHDRTRFQAEAALRRQGATSAATTARTGERARTGASRSIGYVDAMLTVERIAILSTRIADHWRRAASTWTPEQRAELIGRWDEVATELRLTFETDLDSELADLVNGREH